MPDQASAASLLPVADPPLNALLAFVTFFITADIGDSLTGALSDSAPPITETIRQGYTTDPGVETIKPEQLKFPALFMWRKSSTFEERYLNQPFRVSTCGWGYILPPMTFEQAEKYSHICNAVELSFGRALTIGTHPDYNSGAPIGFGISGMRLMSATREIHPAGELSSFYAVMGEFELREDSSESADGFANYDATDYSIGVGNASEILPDLIQADTSVPLQQG